MWRVWRAGQRVQVQGRRWGAGGQCSNVTRRHSYPLTHYSPLRAASRRGGRSSKGKEVKRVLPIRKVRGHQL